MRTEASDAAGFPEDDAPRMTKRLDDIEQRPRNNDDRIREPLSPAGERPHRYLPVGSIHPDRRTSDV